MEKSKPLITQNNRRASLGSALDAMLPSINRGFMLSLREFEERRLNYWKMRFMGVKIGPSKNGRQIMNAAKRGRKK